MIVTPLPVVIGYVIIMNCLGFALMIANIGVVLMVTVMSGRISLRAQMIVEAVEMVFVVGAKI